MDTLAHASANAQGAAQPAYNRLATTTSLLKYTYAIVPIVAGLDKFTHLLTDWNKYLAPVIADMLPFSVDTFMRVVGVIEIIAGILVLLKPKIGALVVSLWLVGIAFNLLLSGEYFDVAVRDLVMAIGAFSLYLLLPDREEAHREMH
ncbi:tRNA (5-methylaminomethyl-2-thiouridylate)-methyltransferase [Pontibacter flavimaris]|uniref:tRNA (5-methylaminomethyl-2-thiouridylate)-methyltransferase n=1 Tax=Pontibacter flavimaris TaxID=1797110 RepID=UPI0009FA72BB|nr:tRNA (5-methylaminomethyl-2-thiouridylate)-methyltransferase [Pontibacter flavimaris]